MTKRVPVTFVDDYFDKKKGRTYDVPPHMVAEYAALGLIEGTRKLDDLTVDELKERLRERGLKVSGTKQELIDRLNADEE
jgi:hypothetical protein